MLEGIRTPDPRLRRPLLYPAELRTLINIAFAISERVMGIEPTYPAWKAGVLPLNYTRIIGVTGFEPATSWSQTRRSSQAEPHPVFQLSLYTFKTSHRSPIFVNILWSSLRPISNSQLHTLLCFHLCPIYLVVFKGSYSLL